jgi:hypothetical protein
LFNSGIVVLCPFISQINFSPSQAFQTKALLVQLVMKSLKYPQQKEVLVLKVSNTAGNDFLETVLLISKNITLFSHSWSFRYVQTKLSVNNAYKVDLLGVK